MASRKSKKSSASGGHPTLADLKKRAGFETWGAVAEAAGLSPAVLGKLRFTECDPRWSTLEALAEVFDVEVPEVHLAMKESWKNPVREKPGRRVKDD